MDYVNRRAHNYGSGSTSGHVRLTEVFEPFLTKNQLNFLKCFKKRPMGTGVAGLRIE